MKTFRNHIDPAYSYHLAQFFSSKFLANIEDFDQEQQLREILSTNGLYPKTKNWALIDGMKVAYRYLKKNYQCEYVYMNEIVNQILIKRHSGNSATLLKEVNSNKSIADVVIINGRTSAYEIKTELDNFERLPNQLKNYQRLYDETYVVTHNSNLKKLKSMVDRSVGIISMDEKCELETVRKATNKNHVFDQCKAGQILRQNELTEAYQKYQGKLPIMGTALVYTFCYDWFVKIDYKIAKRIFRDALKSRGPGSIQFDLFRRSDASCKMMILSRPLSNKFCKTVKERLNIFD